MSTAEQVHSALKQIPTESPFTSTLSMALSLLTKGETLKPYLAEAVKISIAAINASDKGVGDGNKK